MYPVRDGEVLEAVGLDFWTKDPTCIWIVNQEEAQKRKRDGKKEKKENKEDKRSDHQIFNRSKHKGTDHVPKSTKVLDTSIHPIGLFFFLYLTNCCMHLPFSGRTSWTLDNQDSKDQPNPDREKPKTLSSVV
ncbi:hypothetical protein TRV_08094 [Trichophyton verrucosum HKI 0517]|uniref:Uncharacterized protein n=1 Tax=Trichophyton verrucosum (strain HKI 0517) TaxID=663202 RepID=D4DLM0_TRIVH|nr:uncharacterized protein TRV_08094 [Trichophyton verrucosum HKI 0517]EFE37249.1 hypothetical protein TRV_08094 [Trichophyton verrucosum HKI 0517]